MKTVDLQIWSDLACPWCWVGKRRLEAAVAALPPGVSVRTTWRSFELDPAAPRVAPADRPYAERLADKYGTSRAEADAMIDRMTGIARGDGLDFRFDRVRPGNTFDAHRLVHLGRARGVQDAVKERLFRAYLTEGEPLGDPEVLARLAAEAGLETAEARAVLASGAHAREVRADEAEAARLGIHGVPFFVLGMRWGVSGAQPADVLRRAILQAAEAAPELEPEAQLAEGAACGPGGCA